jgi:hypothetical protein
MTVPADVIQTETKPRSRRALLAGALGGLGAVAASAIGRVSPVRAGVDGDVVLGGTNYTTGTTNVWNTSGAGDSAVLSVYHSGNGPAAAATATNGHGIVAHSHNLYGLHGSSVYSVGSAGVSGINSDQPGVAGQSQGNNTGVLGFSGGGAFPAGRPNTGLFGYAAQDNSSRGVIGESPAGHGVRGETSSGAAVFGIATTGYALRTSGRLKADKVSGVATIAAGSTSVTLTPGVNVTSSSFVLLTPKANIGSRGLWFTTNPTADSITIHISSSRSWATKIAWLLVG